MKRGTIQHPKMKRLARRLGSHVAAVGTMESLWHFASQYAMDGDLTKYGSDEIADAVFYEGDPDTIITFLVECGWLDRNEGRLVIHDWSEHCELSVHENIAKKRGRFSDGEKPKLHGLGSGHDAAKRFYEDSNPDSGNSNPDSGNSNPDSGNSNPDSGNSNPDNAYSNPPAKPSQAKPSQAIAIAKPSQANAREEPAHAGGVGALQPFGEYRGRLSLSQKAACTEVGLLAEELLGGRCWGQWVFSCASIYIRSGGEISDWHDLLHKIRDCRDDTVRAKKDLGPPIQNEGGYFRSEATKLMQARSLSVPAFKRQPS